MRNKVALFSVVALLAVPVICFGASSVNSAAIIPADGTSGQNLTSGNGVKTGHIQDGAVTAAKLDAAAVGTESITDGAVTSAKIADGAVTDAKISGIISTGKLNVGTSAGAVAAGDHNHDGIYQKKYSNVLVVAKSGGDYTNPALAVAAIIGGASATNTYLVKIMPGVYDIGDLVLDIGDYIDIEGSGEGVTKITGTAFAGVLYGVGTVGSTVRNLTVESLNPTIRRAAIVYEPMTATFDKVTLIAEGGSYGVGLSLQGATRAIIKDSTIIAGNAMYASGGIVGDGNGSLQLDGVKVVVSGGKGISVSNGIHTINNSTIAVSGLPNIGGNTEGVYVGGGSLEITNSAIDVSGVWAFGIDAWGPATVKIRNSRSKAVATGANPANSIITGPGQTVYVGGSQLETPTGGYGAVKCVTSYNANWDLLSPTCN